MHLVFMTVSHIAKKKISHMTDGTTAANIIDALIHVRGIFVSRFYQHFWRLQTSGKFLTTSNESAFQVFHFLITLAFPMPKAIIKV